MLGSVTAGILVEKGQKRRLTCSFHNWDQHYDKYADKFGMTDPESQRIFQVVQGNSGSRVGFVRERVGNTDIALTQLDEGIVFENNFMEMEYAAKIFLHSRHQSFTDEYILDSFTTGKRKLRGHGRRFQIERRPGRPHYHLVTLEGGAHAPPPTEVILTILTGQRALPPDKVAYIALEQGACVTNDPIMQHKPQIRAGVCGAVLLRCRDGRKRKDRQGAVMERGEICAMMHFADLLQGQERGRGRQLHHLR